MHIETLQTFCNLVETGSFSQAAALGFISQSAVSQQLKALEIRYDRPLIERGSRRGLALTEAGQLFYAECRELLDRFRALEERCGSRQRRSPGPSGSPPSTASGSTSCRRYVTRFMRAHPRVKVHIEYSRTDKVCEDCQGTGSTSASWRFRCVASTAAVIPWRQEKLVLVCAPAHSLARRRRVRLAQLQGAAFIAFERDIPTRKTIDKILKGHRVAVDTVMEFDNIETIKRAVEVGQRPLDPAGHHSDEVKRGLLATVDFAEGRFTRDVGIIHRRGRVLSAAAMRVREAANSNDSRGRLEAQQHAVVLVGDHVDQAVGALAHVADALVQLRQQRLAPQLFQLVVQHHALQAARARHLAAPRAAHEEVALPRREAIAGIEGHSRRRDRRDPQDERLLDARAERAFRLSRAFVACGRS